MRWQPGHRTQTVTCRDVLILGFLLPGISPTEQCQRRDICHRPLSIFAAPILPQKINPERPNPKASETKPESVNPELEPAIRENN